jgi:hypothetical protein
VNLESHRVVELLPDREAATSAAWMRQQLDLMVVSRDRGGEYASAVDSEWVLQNFPESLAVTMSTKRVRLISDPLDKSCSDSRNKR